MQQNEITDENHNNQHEDILEIPEIFQNYSASNYSIPLEFKGIFDLLEIDDKSDFLQLKSENNTDENTRALEISGNEIISIPIELKDVSILTIAISVRLDNVLRSLSIQTLGDLNQKSLSEIKQTKNCGQKTVDELIDLVEQFKDENRVNEILEKFQNQVIICNEKENIFVSFEIRDISMNSFALSTRLAKVFQNLNIRTVGDLENFSIRDLRRTKNNFGKKTLGELRLFVARIENASASQELLEVNTEELTGELNLNSLLNFINSFLDELPEREREIFVERFGGAMDGKIPTLESLGEKYTVTRERIRQIESQIFNKLISRLSGIADNALEQIKYASETAVCPVSIRFLTHLTGNDYDLFVYTPNLYLRILKKLSPKIFISVENQTPIHSDKNIIELSRRIKFLLDDEIHFLPLTEVFGRLISYQTLGEFKIDDFFEAIQDKDFVIENGDTPDVLLIATDKNRLTMTEMAWQVLKNSECPLLPEEIIEEAKKLFGTEIEFHSERSLANLPSYDERFYLLDKRTIGLRQHFKLPEERWDEIADDFYALSLEKQRPLSTTEIINNHLFEWTTQTTPSETAEILREDARFKDLGRFLFALTDWEIEEREPMKYLVVKVLLETDDALTATEIGERIQKYRSVSITSMPTILREHPELKIFDFSSNEERMRLAYYGLRAKDDYRKFFAENETVLKRLVKKFSPIKFTDLCEKLGFDIQGEFVERLWQTLEKIPDLRFIPPYRSSETVIKFSHWHLKSRR